MTVGVKWMAEELGWSHDVSLSLTTTLDWDAVSVIMHIAVVALLRLATDTKFVAYLVD